MQNINRMFVLFAQDNPNLGVAVYHHNYQEHLPTVCLTQIDCPYTLAIVQAPSPLADVFRVVVKTNFYTKNTPLHTHSMYAVSSKAAYRVTQR